VDVLVGKGDVVVLVVEVLVVVLGQEMPQHGSSKSWTRVAVGVTFPVITGVVVR
jgi:hypothetical protein